MSRLFSGLAAGVLHDFDVSHPSLRGLPKDLGLDKPLLVCGAEVGVAGGVGMPQLRMGHLDWRCWARVWMQPRAGVGSGGDSVLGLVIL